MLVPGRRSDQAGSNKPIFLLAFSPAVGKTEGDMGTTAALNLALSGFSSSAVALVAAACIIAAAMTASWLANLIVASLCLQNASAFAILMLLSVFLIVIHLGFASATALASTMIPIVISVLMAVQRSGINVIGMTMPLQFVVSIGFILPVSSRQAMIAYGTDTFTARDFVRTGFVLTLAAMALLVVFSLTYWPMMGYITLPGG